jgi:hypothetical protein
MLRFIYTRVKGDFFENMTRASSGLGYVPQSDCTNDRGGAQIPSAWPSAHFSGTVPRSAAGSSALADGAAAAADEGGAAFAAGSLEGPPPEDAPPHAAARMAIAGSNDRFMAAKETTSARAT